MEVGLSYHGARYYSPALHRWMSPDPVTIHSAGSDFNPYSYGYGNPTSYVDPDGREPFTIIAIIVVAAVVSATTSATVQYATTGHIDWGLKGVAGAAIAGAVGAATGIGVGAMAAGWGIGAGAVGGAAGGAMGGATGTALGGGSLSAIGSSALTGAICGAVGGAVGVWAGSTSSNAATAFGGTMAGTGAGTSAGIAWGALTGDAPTWQSAGIAFGAAFGGAIASTALSSGVQAMADEDADVAEARGQAAGESAQRSSDAQLQTMTESKAEMLAQRLAAFPDLRLAEVTGVFDRKAGLLTLTDVDTHETISVRADSGGRPYGDPIPEGDWEVLERKGRDSFRLDAADASPRNDRHEPTGRTAFRAHGPGRTIGCVAVADDTDYAKVRSLLERTRTTVVTDKFVPWWKPWATDSGSIRRYGQIKVR